MRPSSPPGRRWSADGRVGYLTGPRSAAASPGLAPVHLRCPADHLGPVCLLRCRSVLVDALLLGVLAIQRLAHLGLEVLVVTHPPTFASESAGLDRETRSRE